MVSISATSLNLSFYLWNNKVGNEPLRYCAVRKGGATLGHHLGLSSVNMEYYFSELLWATSSLNQELQFHAFQEAPFIMSNVRVVGEGQVVTINNSGEVLGE